MEKEERAAADKEAKKISPLKQLTIDLTAAFDERSRLFEILRSLYLTDEERQNALEQYSVAANLFDNLRSTILKKKEGK
jgi:hypothetical protein